MADEENPLGGGPFGVGPFGPLIAVAAVAATATFVVVPGPDVVFRRTLQYQSQAFVAVPPEVLAPEATRTPGWMIRWQGPPRYSPPKIIAQPFVPKEAVLENTVTPDKWLIKWQGPPNYNPAPAGGSPFIPKEAVLENTVTPDKWLQRFAKAVPAPKPITTQPVLIYQPVAVANLTTTLEWQPPLSRAARKTWPSLDASELRQFEIPGIRDGIEWVQPFQRAVPPPQRITTQPIIGYEPVAVEAAVAVFVPVNGPVGLFRRTLHYQSVAYCPNKPEVAVDTIPHEQWWHQPLSRAAARPPVHAKPYQPFVPKQFVQDVVGPERWLQRFAKAVPPSRPVPTQPVLGYKAEEAVDTVPHAQWWYQRLSRAVARPAVHAKPYQPFVPPALPIAEAFSSASISSAYLGKKTLFYQSLTQSYYPPAAAAPNSVVGSGFHMPLAGAPDKRWPPLGAYENRQFAVAGARLGIEWLQRWQGPPRGLQRLAGGVVYAPIAPAVSNLTNTLEWLQRWQGPPRYQPPRIAAQPFVPKEAVVENTVIGTHWLQRWQGPPRYWPQNKPYQPFIPKEVIVERVTPDKWLMRWQGPPRYRPIKVQTPPFVPKEATIENTIVGSPANWLYRFQKAIPGRPVWRTQPFFGYPYVDLYVIGGPADESERVVCVPVTSREAVVPVALREVEVPVQTRVVNSNDYRDRPCHDT